MNNLQKIKLFFDTTKPKKRYLVFNLIFWIIYYLVGLYIAVPSANAINSISIGDLNSTIKWLIVTCAAVVFQQIIRFIINRLFYKINKNVWTNVGEQIYGKISVADSESFLQTSKEKIINTVYNNINTLAEFPSNLSMYISYFLQAIITIIILLTYNLIIGSTIITICIVLYFALNSINKAIGKWKDKHYAYEDKALETLADNYTNNELTSDLDLNKTMRQKFLKNLSNSQKAKYKYGMYYSLSENWIPFIYNVLISALSIYMIYLTKSGIFTLTLYLILTKYLTQAITQMMASYNVLSEINSVNVAVLRVKTILEMKSEDLVTFGNNCSDNINGSIVFTNTSYQSKTSETSDDISPFNLSINKNSSTLIYGSPKCGKRIIFKMLNRSVKPTTGTITIDNINIYDFDKETYKHNVALVSNNEYFYNDTIMQNMLLSGANKPQIYEICKSLGIHNKIVSSANSYNTNLTKNPNVLNSFEKYLLGIARALCTNAEILVIYEYPTGLTDRQKDTLKQILQNIGATHTLIIFSHNDMLKTICKNVYKVENHKIVKQAK